MAAAPWFWRHILRLRRTSRQSNLSLVRVHRRSPDKPRTAVSLDSTATCSACQRLGRSLVLRPQHRLEWGARAGTRFAEANALCAEVDELEVANGERVGRSAAQGRTEAEISGARREDFRRRRTRSALQPPRDTRVAPGDLRGLHDAPGRSSHRSACSTRSRARDASLRPRPYGRDPRWS